jgi:hypothetical protein
MTYREWKAKTYKSYYARGGAQSEQSETSAAPAALE